MPYGKLNDFLPAIQSLDPNSYFTKGDLLIGSFLITKEANIQMYYAPHNEYVNKKAKVIIVGITPGWQQMKNAFRQFIISQAAKEGIENSLYHAKIAARFSGTMRKNLIEMLDQCDLPGILNISSSAYLFKENHELLHTTSVIKYPVFVNGKNYTGHQPKIHQSSLLWHYAYHEFANEISKIVQPALVIPLGKAVDQIILKLFAQQKLPYHYYVSGFPHPSGANGHRIKQFHREKQSIQETINKWAHTLTGKNYEDD